MKKLQKKNDYTLPALARRMAPIMREPMEQQQLRLHRLFSVLNTVKGMHDILAAHRKISLAEVEQAIEQAFQEAGA